MPRTVPTYEPTSATAGDSWEWDRTLSDYPPSGGWTLTYSLTGAHESVLSISATTSDLGDYFEVRVAPATTVAYTAGPYKLIGHVTDGTDRFVVYSAPLTVLPDPATATPEFTHAERMLAAIRALLEGRVTEDVQRFQVAGRALEKMEPVELRKWEAVYADRVRMERGGGFFQPVRVRFGVPH